jgi:Tol biopolymer transport system component
VGSPDGRRLLCPLLRDDGEATGIWSADTNALVMLDPSLSRPVWSPRGDAIAGVGSISGPERDLVVEAPDGTGRRTLLSTAASLYSLVWSADGKQIAFALRA